MCTQKIEVVEWYLPECIIDSKVNRQQLPEKKTRVDSSRLEKHEKKK